MYNSSNDMTKIIINKLREDTYKWCFKIQSTTERRFRFCNNYLILYKILNNNHNKKTTGDIKNKS